MKIPMIIPRKKELPKLQIHLRMSVAARLFSALLVYSLVFLPSSFSRAGDGVDSNTITSGATSTQSSGTSTSTSVNNTDGSQTTTTTTPITTTTTTTTVTQTAVPNIVDNPTFTNSQGGGSSTDWTITACGGSGCAFSPTAGFKTSYGTGVIKQSGSIEDIENFNISQTEVGQGMTFSFGADVNNTRKNQIGNNYSQGGTTDTWSIKLEIYNEGGTLLGDEAIGVTGGANMGTTYQTNQTETGILNINAGNNIYSGTLTLSGVDNGYWGGFYGPSFQNIFTTFVYNEIDTQITTSTTYSDLISTVSCEILNACPTEVAQLLQTFEAPTETITETVITSPVISETMPSVPVENSAVQETAETQISAPPAPPIETPVIEAPIIAAPAETFNPEISVETEIQTEMQNATESDTSISESLDISESGGDLSADSQPEPESTMESTATTETEVETESTETTEVEPEVTEPGPESTETASETEPASESTAEKSAEVREEQPAEESKPSNKGGKVKPANVKTVKAKTKTPPKKLTKKQVKQKIAKAKQKAAEKIIKKMGDKGKYEGGNQLKTVIIMNVLGNSKQFFTAQAKLRDTPGFFSSTRVPDTVISDNNYAAYGLIMGSDVTHDALVNSQYRR